MSPAGASLPIVLVPVGTDEDALRQLEGEYQDFVEQRNDVVRELLSDPYNADVTLLPESDSARYKVRMMTAVMNRLKPTITWLGGTDCVPSA